MDDWFADHSIYCYLTLVISLQVCVHADNIALNKQATQLGSWGTDNGAGKAVDGGLSQKLGDGSCAHPDSNGFGVSEQERGDPAWWSVDLASQNPTDRFIIENVTIYFRDDCCENRVEGNVIYVGVMSGWQNQEECGRITSTDSIHNVPCRPGKPVRYLTIRHQTQVALTLCEVIVNGYKYQDCPAGRFGTSCTSVCQCRDLNEVCNKQTGRCASGCLDDFWGESCSNSVPMVQGQPTVVGKTQTSVTLSFTPSTGQVDQYQVEYYKRSGFSSNYFGGAVIQHSNVPTLQITQVRLQPETSYQLRIVPYVSTTRGKHSDPVITATLGIPVIDMAPTTSSVTTNSVVIHFRPSDPPAVSYRVQDRTPVTNYQDRPKIAHSDNIPEYSIKLDNLIANTEYEIRVVPLYGPHETQGYSSPSVVIRTSQKIIPPLPTPTSGQTSPESTASVTTQTKETFSSTSVDIHFGRSPSTTSVSHTTEISASGKSTDNLTSTEDISEGSKALTGIISGAVAGVVFLIILTGIITYLVTRSSVGKPIRLKCRTCVYVDSTPDSVENPDSTLKRRDGQVFNVTNEMRLMNMNNAALAEDGMQSTYEELEDTSYQEISPPYTELVTSKQNNSSGKYINVQMNQGNNIRKGLTTATTSSTSRNTPPKSTPGSGYVNVNDKP